MKVAAFAMTFFLASLCFAQHAHDHGHEEHGDAHAEGPAEHSDEVKLTSAAITQAGIRLGEPQKRVLASTVVAAGRVAFDGDAMAHVGSPVSGRVSEIKVRQGDSVKRGDPLLLIESPELARAQSDYLQKQTQLHVSTAATAPAKAAYERAQQLFEQSQGIALAEVQKREVELRSVEGTLASAKASLDAARNELTLLGFDGEAVALLESKREILTRFTLRAPIDGRVIEREVTQGELVSPDKERLLVVADVSRVWVVADVPEAKLMSVGIGSRAQITTASGGSPIAGEVSLVSAEIDPLTRSARVRIIVSNTGANLRPGMFARVSLAPAIAGEAVLAIPEEAVQFVEGQSSVFVPVAGEANTFARRPVIVGRSVNGFVPVIDGLSDHEALVIAGSFVLKAELGKGAAEHTH